MGSSGLVEARITTGTVGVKTFRVRDSLAEVLGVNLSGSVLIGKY